MEKDFDGWNEHKKLIHIREKSKFFHEREIWWCSLGINIGYEQDGTNDLYERPVLIVKKFNRNVLWVLPLTRTDKDNRYYFSISVGDTNSAVILSQLRLISSKRLQRYMHKLPKSQFKKILNRMKQFFPKL